MLFSNLNTLRKPKQEHLEKVSNALSLVEFISPDKLVKKTGLTLTAVKCVLEEMNKYGSIDIKRQQVSPRLSVKLKECNVKV